MVSHSRCGQLLPKTQCPPCVESQQTEPAFQAVGVDGCLLQSGAMALWSVSSNPMMLVKFSKNMHMHYQS